MGDRELLLRGGGVTQGALELAREVPREPRGKVGPLELAQLGDGRRSRGDIALEDLGEQMLVDAFAQRGRRESEGT